MSKWVVNFKGWCVVEGSDYEEAADNFFNHIGSDSQNVIRDEEYYIADIESCESENEANE